MHYTSQCQLRQIHQKTTCNQSSIYQR